MLQCEMRIIHRLDKGGIEPVIGKGAIEVDKDELVRMSPLLTNRLHMTLDGLLAEAASLLTKKNLPEGKRTSIEDVLALYQFGKSNPDKVVGVTKWSDGEKNFLRLEIEK